MYCSGHIYQNISNLTSILIIEFISYDKEIKQAVYKIERKIRKIIYRNYFKRDQFKVYNRLGLNLLLNYANYIDRHLIIKQPYEKEQLKHLDEILNSNKFDLFLDIGANIGLYSLIAAKSGKIQKIFAFEPDLRNNFQFKSNIVINRFINVIKVFDYGLSNKEATVSFLQQNGTSTGQSRVKATSPVSTDTSRYKSTEINVKKFDNEFSNFQKQKVFIKIDVEGHELSVLEGMKNFLINNRCTLQIEIFDENLMKVEKILSELNYSKKIEFGADRIFKNNYSKTLV